MMMKMPRYQIHFFNIVKHLKITEFKDIDFSAECITHPAFKAMMKFRSVSV